MTRTRSESSGTQTWRQEPSCTQKLQLRKEQNRRSAAESRARKIQEVSDLTERVVALERKVRQCRDELVEKDKIIAQLKSQRPEHDVPLVHTFHPSLPWLGTF